MKGGKRGVYIFGRSPRPQIFSSSPEAPCELIRDFDEVLEISTLKLIHVGCDAVVNEGKEITLVIVVVCPGSRGLSLEMIDIYLPNFVQNTNKTMS